MNNKSKNGLDLIRISASKVKGVWGKVFLATIIYLAPLILLCAIPYAGWAISFAMFGYLTLGYLNYMQQIMGGQNPSLKVLFVQKEFMQAIILGIILAVGVAVGLVLFIIPGILMIGYYSLALFVLNEEKIASVTDTLNVCARKMIGNKTAMFAYKVIFYLGYALVGTATIIAMMFIAELYATLLALGIVLTVVLAAVSISLLALITMYMYAANVVFYDEIVRPTVVEEYSVKAPAPAEEAKVEVPAEEVKENVEVKEEVKEEVKKAPAKKTTTKKSTSTTATKTTATKTTTKKTTTKKATKE